MIQQTEAYVKEILSRDASGHDWFHIKRVRNIALQLQKEEGGDAFIIEMAALLHDVADEKLNASEEEGLEKVTNFLHTLGVAPLPQEHILSIIKNMSFKGGHGGHVSTIEGKIVQDADRLDALGAIGIARTFAYGGKKGQLLYDPNIPYRQDMTKEEYRQGESTSLNHFYEKLLKLKDSMHTAAAKQEAAKRHTYMEQFVQQFMKEWNGQL